MKSNRFSTAARIKSFRYAGEGIVSFLKSEHNSWIHLGATIGVVIAGFVFQLSKFEWISIIVAIALVWIAEMINTCIEHLMDYLSASYNKEIKFIKDVAAGAVLMAAIASFTIGLIVFIPYLIN